MFDTIKHINVAVMKYINLTTGVFLRISKCILKKILIRIEHTAYKYTCPVTIKPDALSPKLGIITGRKSDKMGIAKEANASAITPRFFALIK